MFPIGFCFTLFLREPETISISPRMFPAQPFPLVPARLSGSRTAPRGSHVWLSQSSLRAPARGGGVVAIARVCVFFAWKRMRGWISRAALSVCFSSFGQGRPCEFQGSNYFWFVCSARKLKTSVMFWDSALIFISLLIVFSCFSGTNHTRGFLQLQQLLPTERKAVQIG